VTQGKSNLHPFTGVAQVHFFGWHFGSISSGFCCHAAQKAYKFGKIFKLRTRDQFRLATPDLKNKDFLNLSFISAHSEISSDNFTTVLPRKQLSEYYSNFQIKMFKCPKHLMTFCRRIRIVLTELYSG
jgi:hypothetical protein